MEKELKDLEKKNISYYQGTFCATEKGFGFIKTQKEGEPDLYVAREDTMSAFSGDEVYYILKEDVENNKSEAKRRGRGSGRPKKNVANGHREAKVVRIINHSVTEIVGLVDMCKGFAFVIPDNPGVYQDIYVDKKDLAGAKDYDKVVVEITEYPKEKRRSPIGKVIEVLGNVEDAGVDVLAVAKANRIPMKFPEEEIALAASLPNAIDPEEVEQMISSGIRTDFRDQKIITIDSEYAKDLDDAIFVEKIKGSKGETLYRLGVHIADVSHYVREGDAFDREAVMRGTSVYLVDRVIPMLPKELSNGLCSLNEGCERYTLSCIMDINTEGEIVAHKVCEGVIRVAHRMCYNDVRKIIDPAEEDSMEQCENLRKKYSDIVPMLDLAYELSGLIREKRGYRGAIDFESNECRFDLDEHGHVIDVLPEVPDCATKMIEDFMLCANETIAEDFFWQEVPFLFRVHAEPDSDKMKEFSTFIKHFGYTLHIGGDGKVHPKKLQTLLADVSGSKYENLISKVLLRSMKKAEYTTVNYGHFGLSAKYYTHFTSPIRRYPDLQIHRIIKEILRGEFTAERQEHYRQILEEVADNATKTEIRAASTERSVDKMKKAQYMYNHIGETFTGIVSGVNNWGFYVELANTVEGLVRLSEMNDDFYTVDLANYTVTGSGTGRSYLLGQEVSVRCEDVDLLKNNIDFSVAKQRKKRNETNVER